MTDQWIRAADALQLLQPRLSADNAAMAICRRAHAGLVRAKAARFIHPQGVDDDLKVPADFWWAEGNEALGQSWETGDFETWVDDNSDYSGDVVHHHFYPAGIEVAGLELERSETQSRIMQPLGRAARLASLTHAPPIEPPAA